MIVSYAHYNTYRNLEDVSLKLSPEVNVLYGMNAQGKSNLLEGIYYFARGRSFRGVKDKDLIMFGRDYGRLEIGYIRDGGANTTALAVLLQQNGKKKITREGAPLRGSAEMVGMFRAVLFCPSHLSIVSGGPAERRVFLDIAISQVSSEYIHYLGRYKKYLAERNALLKRYSSGIPVSVEEWETYATALSSAAAEIYTLRQKYCNMLSEDVAAYFEKMTSGKETPRLRYTSHLDVTPIDDGEIHDVRESSAEELYKRLTTNIEREAAAGSTLWGPHKDDIHISINEREARLFGSQGQCRSLALGMKLAEGEISRRLTGEYPVFLLDDVFSELDDMRRRFIMDELRGRQIIVTSCEPGVVPSDGDNATFYRVEDGIIDEGVCR